MILIAIGSNLAGPMLGSPRRTAEAGLAALAQSGATIVKASSWYESEPIPSSDQPWYVNAVARIATDLAPLALLDQLLAVEARFGRARSERNAARTLDLDLLDFDGQIYDTERLVLPHPRLHERRFVLAPLCEIAPRWRHATLGLTARELLAGLPPGQPVRRLRERGG